MKGCFSVMNIGRGGRKVKSRKIAIFIVDDY